MQQRYRFLLSLLLIGLIGLSCEKDPTEPEYLLDPVPENIIRFNAMGVGQRSYYLLAELDLREGKQTIRYTGDTLVLELRGRDGDLFLVRETLTPGSPNRDTVTTKYCDVVEYGLRYVEGILTAERTVDCQYSRLFDQLPRTLQVAPGFLTAAALDGQLVAAFDDGNDDLLSQGYLEGFEQQDLRFTRLQVLVDNSQTLYDGNQLSWLYNADYGVARFVAYSAFGRKGVVAELVDR